MDISIAAIRIAFIALPGLIAAQIYRKLRGRRPKEAWETFFEVLFFSVISYTLWIFVTVSWAKIEAHCNSTSAGGSVGLAGQLLGSLTTALFDEKASPEWLKLMPIAVAPSCIIGILLALFASLVHNKKWLNRFARRIGVSCRHGDEDLWEDIFNDAITDEWIFVRDHKLDLIYFGHPAMYSESQRPRELVLTNVSVYSNSDTSKPLYNAKVLYVSRQTDELSIEIPDLPKESKNVEQNDTANHRGGNGKEGRSEAGGDDPKA